MGIEMISKKRRREMKDSEGKRVKGRKLINEKFIGKVEWVRVVWNWGVRNGIIILYRWLVCK